MSTNQALDPAQCRCEIFRPEEPRQLCVQAAGLALLCNPLVTQVR